MSLVTLPVHRDSEPQRVQPWPPVLHSRQIQSADFSFLSSSESVTKKASSPFLIFSSLPDNFSALLLIFCIVNCCVPGGLIVVCSLYFCLSPCSLNPLAPACRRHWRTQSIELVSRVDIRNSEAQLRLHAVALTALKKTPLSFSFMPCSER